MNAHRYDELEKLLIEEAFSMAREKRKSYADGVDMLSNFKRTAERTGITKYQVWLNFFEKHLMAMESAIRGDPTKPIDYSENLRGRIKDGLNYLILFAALLDEEDLL